MKRLLLVALGIVLIITIHLGIRNQNTPITENNDRRSFSNATKETPKEIPKDIAQVVHTDPLTNPESAEFKAAVAKLKERQERLTQAFHGSRNVDPVWTERKDMTIAPSDKPRLIRFTESGEFEGMGHLSSNPGNTARVRILPGLYYRVIDLKEHIVYENLVPLSITRWDNAEQGKIVSGGIRVLPTSFDIQIPPVPTGYRVEAFWARGNEERPKDTTIGFKPTAIITIK